MRECCGIHALASPFSASFHAFVEGPVLHGSAKHNVVRHRIVILENNLQLRAWCCFDERAVILHLSRRGRDGDHLNLVRQCMAGGRKQNNEGNAHREVSERWSLAEIFSYLLPICVLP